jgi:hypothetical protein
MLSMQSACTQVCLPAFEAVDGMVATPPSASFRAVDPTTVLIDRSTFVDPSRFGPVVGHLAHEAMTAVDAGLQRAFGLDGLEGPAGLSAPSSRPPATGRSVDRPRPVHRQVAVVLDGQQVGLERLLEVGRPPGLEHGVPIDTRFTLAVGPMLLPPGRYRWLLDAAGQQFAAGFTVMTPTA